MTTNNSWNSAYPAAVPQGGTGDSSLTAYGSLCGGTSTTSPIQVVSPGTAGYIYAANGVSALPSWVAPGTVGGKAFIASQTAAGSSFIDFNNELTSSSFEIYIIYFDLLRPSTNATNLQLQVGTGSTPTYVTSGYAGVINTLSTGANSGVASGTTALDLQINTSAVGQVNTSNIWATGWVQIGQASAGFCSFLSNISYVDYNVGTPLTTVALTAGNCTNAAATSIRFLYKAGVIEQGNFYLYGLAN
jgi:hypothetical protein